jgi:hypothetical protein
MVRTSSQAAMSCEGVPQAVQGAVDLQDAHYCREILAQAARGPESAVPSSDTGCRRGPGPSPSASRRSSWRARCDLSSAASQGEIATLRRPVFVFGDLTWMEPLVCSSERSIRTTFF